MNKLDHKISRKIFDSSVDSSNFWSRISRRGLFGYLFAFLAVWFVSNSEFYAILFFALSVSVSFTITLIIRYIVRRKRPNFGSLYKPMLNSYSFPSAHASVAFAMATSVSMLAIDLWSGPLLWLGIVLLFVGAVAISISRVFVGVHYLGDVIWGALIGILTSVILVGL